MHVNVCSTSFDQFLENKMTYFKNLSLEFTYRQPGLKDPTTNQSLESGFVWLLCECEGELWMLSELTEEVDWIVSKNWS